MKVVCAWCLREGRPGLIGERAPLDDPAVTHGICLRHNEQLLAQVPARSFPGVRLLVVVSAAEAKLYSYLEHSCATVADVRVIVDRRRTDRRAAVVSVALDRRQRDRRRRSGNRSPLGYQYVRFGQATGPTSASHG